MTVCSNGICSYSTILNWAGGITRMHKTYKEYSRPKDISLHEGVLLWLSRQIGTRNSHAASDARVCSVNAIHMQHPVARSITWACQDALWESSGSLGKVVMRFPVQGLSWVVSPSAHHQWSY
jgi:hypothetical protein